MLLTGATGGLGRAIASALAERGATAGAELPQAGRARAARGRAARRWAPHGGQRSRRRGSGGGAGGRGRRCRRLRRQRRAARNRATRASAPSRRSRACCMSTSRPRSAPPTRCCLGCSSAAAVTSSTSPRSPARPPRRARRCTTPRSSACAASRSPSARTCTAAGSAPRWCSPASSATPGCSPTRACPRRPGSAPARPEQVGDAVVKAIEADKAEIIVAPPQQRALSSFAHVFPSAAAAVQRGGGEKIAEELAERQSEKR